MSRAREVLKSFSEGFLQQPFQITPLFKLILQLEKVSSTRVHSSSWRLLTTKQQCNTSTRLAVLLQHFFSPFFLQVLVQ